jgi:hypothetical protein
MLDIIIVGAIPHTDQLDGIPALRHFAISRQIIESIDQGASDVAPMVSRQTPTVSRQTTATAVALSSTPDAQRRPL